MRERKRGGTSRSEKSSISPSRSPKGSAVFTKTGSSTAIWSLRTSWLARICRLRSSILESQNKLGASLLLLSIFLQGGIELLNSCLDSPHTQHLLMYLLWDAWSPKCTSKNPCSKETQRWTRLVSCALFWAPLHPKTGLRDTSMRSKKASISQSTLQLNWWAPYRTALKTQLTLSLNAWYGTHWKEPLLLSCCLIRSWILSRSYGKFRMKMFI